MKEELSCKRLSKLLSGEGAHMSLMEAVAGFPKEHINTKPQNIDYTFWHLLEHIRIAQWDILDFMINPDYKDMKWPDDYWPAKNVKTDWKGWEKTIEFYNKDLTKIKKIIKDPKTDSFAKIPWGKNNATIFKEVLLIADHTAYHTGEFAILRQVEKVW